MNERIKNMLEQPVFDRLWDWYNIGPVQRATLEDFTELIVKECVDRIQGCHLVLERDGEFERGYKKAIDKATNQVLLHFGVE